MDPIANKIAQLEISSQILKIWDDCNADGTLTKGQMEEVADLSNRLAELVQALAGWENWARLKNTLVR
jgi:hypothetical protein